MNTPSNNPLQNKIDKDLDRTILIELLTHFTYKLQSLLGISINACDKHNYIPLDKLSIKQLRQKLSLIENRVEEIVRSNQKNSINDLLMELKEDNESIGREIDNLSTMQNTMLNTLNNDM